MTSLLIFLCVSVNDTQDVGEEGEIKKHSEADSDEEEDDEGEEGLRKGKLSIKRKGRGIAAGGKSKTVQGQWLDSLNWYIENEIRYDLRVWLQEIYRG